MDNQNQDKVKSNQNLENMQSENVVDQDLNGKNQKENKKIKKTIKHLEQELTDLKNELLMQIADKQNTVKMFQNDLKSLKKYGSKQLALDLLPAIDMLKIVVGTKNDNPEIQNYLVGFQMVVNQIDQALASNGIVKIETKIGDQFDLNLHNAVELVENPQFKSGQIVEIIANGYKIYDRVLKHAIVKVAK